MLSENETSVKVIDRLHNRQTFVMKIYRSSSALFLGEVLSVQLCFASDVQDVDLMVKQRQQLNEIVDTIKRY